MDEKIIGAKPTAEEEEEKNKVYEGFLKIAGEDKEVDWKELKEILDDSMQDELKSSGGNYYKKTASNANAAPSNGNLHDETGQQENFFMQLLSLICGHFCEGSPLQDVLPKSTQSAPLLSTFADLTKTGFSKDICRSMIAMMDLDRSGKLGYEEFKRLWESLRNWKNVWILYDTDKSGALSDFEFRNAIESAGYRLNNRILNVLMHRYGTRNGELKFDDFILCAIKTKIMIDTFKAKDKADSNAATFSLEEWLESTLCT